jgi:hypothetical protein
VVQAFKVFVKRIVKDQITDDLWSGKIWNDENLIWKDLGEKVAHSINEIDLSPNIEFVINSVFRNIEKEKHS